MPISVQQIYTEVCDSLLEPGGLTGKTLTDGRFFELLNEAVVELIGYGSYAKLCCMQTELGVRVYNEPLRVSNVNQLAVAETALPMNSGFYWDKSSAGWQNESPGEPSEWRQDQLDQQRVEIRPSPAWTGYEVEFPGIGFYGVASQWTAGTYDIEVDPAYASGLIGTISECDYGAVYVEFTSPMFGVISAAVPSQLNITEFAAITPDYAINSLDQFIPDINPSFAPYLKMLVLNGVHAGDSESKSLALAKYYQTRTDEGESLIGAICSQGAE